jgi:hypothetical protein
MPHLKSTAVRLPAARDYRRELEFLYARKSAIDRLIRSLEQYHSQGKTPTPEESQRKSA